EGDEAARSQQVLYVVSKKPEIQHIPAKMQDIRMQEHGGKDREPRGHQRIANHRSLMEQISRNRGQRQDEFFLLRTEGDLKKEHQAVQNDEADGDKRCQRGGIVVSERDHFTSGAERPTVAYSPQTVNFKRM